MDDSDAGLYKWLSDTVHLVFDPTAPFLLCKFRIALVFVSFRGYHLHQRLPRVFASASGSSARHNVILMTILVVPVTEVFKMGNSGGLQLTSLKATQLIPQWPSVLIQITLISSVACVYFWESSINHVSQTDPSGLQLFHLLSHTDGSGGATLLVDGFYVASLLKELHPDLYDILSRIPIPAHAAGEPTVLYKPSLPSGHPTLQHDLVTKELIHVRWNNDDRSVMNHLHPDLVEKWYARWIYGFKITAY